MGVLAIREWPIIRNFFGSSSNETSVKERTAIFNESVNHVRFKNYALNICISRIANAISLCGFQTFIRGKPMKGDIWWKLNYEPNQNQNQADFIYDIVYQMVYNYDDGALIIQAKNGDLIVAESFTVEHFSFKPNVYSNIILPGGMSYSSSLIESDVINLKYNNRKVKEIVDQVYEDFGRLLNDSIRNYNRGNAIKLKLKIDGQFEQFKEKDILDEEGNVIGNEYDDILDDIFENRFKAIFSDKDSISPLEEGLDLLKIDVSPGNDKSGAVTSRDIASIFDDILNQAADAFHIPRGILKGDVADNEGMRTSMIDDVIRPIIENFQTEFNRKLYGKDEFLKGSKLKILTDLIYTKDPIAFANAAEAYLRIGVYCVNDILQKLGEEVIDEPWAWEHYVTKNYENINQTADEIQGAVSKLMLKLGRSTVSEDTT